MTYVGPGFGLTYINLRLDPQKSEPICATREHSTPPPWATPGGFTGCVHITLTISHAQCAIAFSHNGIAKVLGLPKYVASTTKSRTQASLQRCGPQSTQVGHYVKIQT